MYTWTWAVNEYCIRQGHGSYVEVVEAGQSATSCSSTGFLKPTYDEQGRMKVMKPEMLLAVIMDMAAGGVRRGASPPGGGGCGGHPSLRQRANSATTPEPFGH